MPSQTLPPEVDDIVLDHLYDDRATLAQCASVCRSWLATSRLHFWRELRLACSENELRRLQDLLKASPDATAYVRSAVVVHNSSELSQLQDASILYVVLASLGELPDLNSITLEALWFATSPDCLSPLSTVHLPSVRRLRFANCTFKHFCDIQRIRDACPNITALQLDGLQWGCCTTASPKKRCDAVQISKLQDVSVGGCFSRIRVFDWLLATSPPGSIQRLSLPVLSVYDDHLRKFLAGVGSSLKHLEIGSPSASSGAVIEFDKLEPHLDLTHTTALQSVTLGVPTYRDAAYITQWLIFLLRSLRASVLSHVSFALFPIYALDSEQAAAILGAYEWAAVADLLKSERFGTVRRVSFVTGREEDYHGAEDMFVKLEEVVRRVVTPVFGVLVEKGIEVEVQCW